MSNVLIIGASGLVGSYLYRLISNECDTTGTFRGHPLKNAIYLDITDRQAVEDTVSRISPDYIFLPAALTNVDRCEEEKELCFRVNVGGTQNIVDALKGTAAKIVYFSTDYIFDGRNGPYSESDQPHPLTEYGKSKLEGETNIQKALNNFLIIRTTCVYGWEPQEKNFVIKLIKKIKTGGKIEVPIDQITTPTYAGNLAEISWNLAKKDKRGIYNVAGNSLLSRLEFAYLVSAIFGLDRSLIQGVKTQVMQHRALRPLNGGLKIDKIKEELGLGIPGSREGLLLMQKERAYE